LGFTGGTDALDLEVYALGALYILGPSFVRSLPERAARFGRLVEKVEEREVPAPPRPQLTLLHRKQRGWINSWRE